MTGMLSTITDEIKYCFCVKTDGNANAFQLLPGSVREGYVPKTRLDAGRPITVLWSCMKWGKQTLPRKNGDRGWWMERDSPGSQVWLELFVPNLLATFLL